MNEPQGLHDQASLAFGNAAYPNAPSRVDIGQLYRNKGLVLIERGALVQAGTQDASVGWGFGPHLFGQQINSGGGMC